LPAGGAPLATPDGRYIIVRGRLWRAANPGLPPEVRQGLVDQLMDARRAVKAAMQAGDAAAERTARANVDSAKQALGERGPVWWRDGAPDLNRKLVANTVYASWFAGQAGAQDAAAQSGASTSSSGRSARMRNSVK